MTQQDGVNNSSKKGETLSSSRRVLEGFFPCVETFFHNWISSSRRAGLSLRPTGRFSARFAEFSDLHELGMPSGSSCLQHLRGFYPDWDTDLPQCSLLEGEAEAPQALRGLSDLQKLRGIPAQSRSVRQIQENLDVRC